ncbi:MAG: hypothetical protein R2882_06785 [Gemmatimonadales bacterium]
MAVVVVTSAIGTGIERGVQQGLDRLGANLLVVRPATVPRSVARREIRGAYTSLRPADAAAIASLWPSGRRLQVSRARAGSRPVR